MKLSDKIIICTILLVLILIYFKYNQHQNMEHFAVCANEPAFIGNPLIKRDGTNLTYDPSLSNGIEARNAILGYGNATTGWEGERDNELIVRFGKTYNLKSIIIGGFGKFKVQVEIVDTSNNIKTWKTLHNTNNTNNTEIFEGGNNQIGFSTKQNSSCFNLKVDGSSNIMCQAIKFKVYQVQRVKAQFEVLGLELDGNPVYQNEDYLNPHAKLYNEDGNAVSPSGNNVLAWRAESGNSNPHCVVKFESSSSTPVANKLISYIEIEPNNNAWLTSLNIAFSYQGSSITRHVTEIPGNSGVGTISRFYFKYPLLANELEIKPTSPSSFDSSIASGRPACKIKLYGKVISSVSEENTLKSEQETYYQINNSRHGKRTCPPVNSLINKQAEIQQLCDALEQTDEIEYQKKKIDTNKMYQLKLAKQRKEIEELQAKIGSMRDANKQFNDIEDRNKIAMYDYQAKLDEKLKTLVKKRLDTQSAVNLNFSVKDTQNNTVTETFINRGQNNLSKKFVNRKFMTPPEHFYEEFVGSHYFN